MVQYYHYYTNNFFKSYYIKNRRTDVNPSSLKPTISKGIFYSLQTTKMPIPMKMEDLCKLHT